jgi:acetoin utilization deacetylase AcuC-like enzyme/GNAT superfamily N-acetyltransferase
MFRIRRVFDDILPINRQAIGQMQDILRAQFPISEEEIAKFSEQMRDPLKYRFRTILFVAEDEHRDVRGLALLLHAPDLKFAYLDFIATARTRMGGGIGGALYERAREEALSLKVIGLFMECLPDDPKLCGNAQKCRENAARLLFYERYGARPIANTAYETPLKPGDDNPPYLVFDDLGQGKPLRRDEARAIVRAILERKYPDLVPKVYVDMVVESFQEDPVRLRPYLYVKRDAPLPVKRSVSDDKRIALVVNNKHAIHHVRERGYVESPVRIQSIMRQLQRTDLFLEIPVKHFPERHIKAVHDAEFVDYLRRACENLEEDESIYPYVFPIRNAARPPLELALRAGYYCIDTFTPINRNAYLAAKRAVDCALTAADQILLGRRLAYALVRPPGHHAERRAFGGFCYFNSAAAAAHYLSAHGNVAILDVDYHHGNGQQNIFYERSDVLTVSIHCHPRFAYPYFSGFAEEIGEAAGQGYNANYALPKQVNGERYQQTLEKALKRVAQFHPSFLVVALGLDTAKGDPTGSWTLRSADFETNGRMIGSLRLPTVVVQEGGYDSRVLGTNARHFFQGLWHTAIVDTPFYRR